MLRTDDGSLSRFVFKFCEKSRIVCDGDVMGQAFSEKEEYSEEEVRKIVNDMADIYQLRLK